MKKNRKRCTIVVLVLVLCVAVPEEEAGRIFERALLKRCMGGALQMPEYAFEIHFKDGAQSFDFVIGSDGSVSAANRDDLQETRKFYRDVDGQLFLQLYAVYLNCGGTDLLAAKTVE